MKIFLPTVKGEISSMYEYIPAHFQDPIELFIVAMRIRDYHNIQFLSNGLCLHFHFLNISFHLFIIFLNWLFHISVAFL